MPDDVQISIYGSCNRPHLWQWFYDNLSMNNVNFEIVFVGNVEPKFKLPPNFQFIYSDVKPVQCNQIALLNCIGEVNMVVADDVQFSPHALDKLYETYREQDDYKCMVGPKFIGVLNTPSSINEIQKMADDAVPSLSNPDLRFIYNDFNSPPILVTGLISAEFIAELNTYDRKFIMCFADMDMQMRAKVAGGKILYRDDVWLAERKDLCPNWINGTSKDFSPHDRELLHKLWMENNHFSNKRLMEIESFEENDALLIESQGPKGKWN